MGINLNKLNNQQRSDDIQTPAAPVHDVQGPESSPSITKLVKYYIALTQGFFYSLMKFVFGVAHHPLGIFNLLQLTLALVLFWRHFLLCKNPCTVLKRTITHLFYEARRLLHGMDIKYYRHSVAYDLGRMNYDVIKENIMIDDVVPDKEIMIKAYEPPIEKEIRDFSEAEKLRQRLNIN